ncbi:MAG: response regulator [Mariprofundales bacterium]|nr:response regulator [Mariprofundales bacterium]
MAMIKKVMIIDDEPEVRSVLGDFTELYFQKMGGECRVELLDSPVEALFCLTDGRAGYAAILLDVRMPLMGGDDVFRAILSMDTAMAARVVFVTGYADDVKRHYPDRELTVLMKPFSFEAFSQVMTKVLQPAA